MSVNMPGQFLLNFMCSFKAGRVGGGGVWGIFFDWPRARDQDDCQVFRYLPEIEIFISSTAGLIAMKFGM